jgi:hypothetical protein
VITALVGLDGALLGLLGVGHVKTSVEIDAKSGRANMPSHPAAVKQNQPFKPYHHCFQGGACVEFALPDFRVLVGWPSGLRRTPGKCVYVNSVPRVQIPIPPPDHCFS